MFIPFANFQFVVHKLRLTSTLKYKSMFWILQPIKTYKRGNILVGYAHKRHITIRGWAQCDNRQFDCGSDYSVWWIQITYESTSVLAKINTPHTETDMFGFVPNVAGAFKYICTDEYFSRYYYDLSLNAKFLSIMSYLGTYDLPLYSNL